MNSPKILIAGSTGYLGGSFLNHFLNSTNAALKNAQYTIVLRKASQKDLFKNLNVEKHVLQNTDDLEELRSLASGFDIIINSAYTMVPEHAKALVQGLGDRKKKNPQGPTPYIIHQSGTSNVADRPHSNPGRKQPVEHVDTKSKDIYEFEKKLEAGEPYPPRTTELAVIDTAEDVGVKSVVIMSPTIYGTGTGPGNKSSIQIPILIRAVKKNGYATVAGDGSQEWDHVSLEDLAALFELVVERIISGAPIPTNRNGILFSETGRRTWRELAQVIINTGVRLGAIPKDTPIREVSMQEAADSYGLGAAALFVELGLLSNSRTKSDVSRELGWKAKDGQDGYKKGVEQDWAVILKDTKPGET